MKIKALLLALMVAMVSCTADQVQQAGPVDPSPLVLTDEQQEYPLGLHLEILEDPSGALTIEDVTSPDYARQFVTSQVEAPSFGYSTSAYWVRLPVRNESRTTERWLLEIAYANVQFVDLYSPLPRPGGSRGGFAVKQTGAFRPPQSRDIRHVYFVFDLTIPSESQQTYYLRFQGGSLTLPLSMWTADAFSLHTQTGLALRSLFFGALLVLLVYNVFLFFSDRQKNYLYLAMVLASMIAFDVIYSGYAEAYLVPNLYFLKRYFQVVMFMVLFASMVLFADSFLELKTQAHRLHRLSVAILIGWGAFMVLVPFTTFSRIARLGMPFALLSAAVIFASGLIVWWRGFPYSRFFMIAWLGLAVGFAVTILVRLGVIPSNLLSEHSYQTGVLWMAVFWSFALADRINILKTDLQRSEHRLSQILEGLPLGVVMYGTDQKPRYANRRVVEILSNPARDIEPDLSAGRTLAEAMGYYSFRLGGSDQAYPLARMPVYRALQGEAAAVDDIEADLIDKRVPLEIWASPVLDAGGEVESAVVAFQDITRRKHNERELAEHRNRLERLVDERTQRLAELNERLIKLISWLSAINEIQQQPGGRARLLQMHEHLLMTISQLLGAKSVFICIWGDRRDPVAVLSCFQPDAPIGGTRGPSNGAPASLETIPFTCDRDSTLRAKVEQGKRLILAIDHDSEMLAPLKACLQHEDVRSVILAPLQTERGIVGLLGVGMAQPAATFSDEQEVLFERMELDLANLAEFARLHDAERSLAAAEERNRLARDLHDSVTQVLFSASLLAESLPTIWRRDPEQAAESLEGLKRLTRGALAEMRTMLLELRPASVLKTPLPELLAQLTEAITSRSAVPFQLHIEQVYALPDDVHIGYYHIAQEALNNVVKHAQASRVEVSLAATSPLSGEVAADQGVTMVIADNGVGFSVEDPRAKHMGLGIMHERATAINADLFIDSQPGRGTAITLSWPRGSS